MGKIKSLSVLIGKDFIVFWLNSIVSSVFRNWPNLAETGQSQPDIPGRPDLAAASY